MGFGRHFRCTHGKIWKHASRGTQKWNKNNAMARRQSQLKSYGKAGIRSHSFDVRRDLHPRMLESLRLRFWHFIVDIMSSTCWKRATKRSNGHTAVDELDRLVVPAVENLILEKLTQSSAIKVFYFPIQWKLSQTHIQSWTRSCVVFVRKRQWQVLEPSKSFKFRIWVWMARSRTANSHCIVASTGSRIGISMSRHALQTRARVSMSVRAHWSGRPTCDSHKSLAANIDVPRVRARPIKILLLQNNGIIYWRGCG